MKRIFICWMLFLLNCISTFSQAVTEKSSDCQELSNKNQQYESQLSDWAQLSRYREANIKLSPLSVTETRVVFMGDSITDGWNLAHYFPGKAYINRGIGGQTTPQMLLRFRPDVIELKPKVVVILAGTNDISGNTGPMTLEDTSRNLSSMVELAQVNKIRVILSSVLPVNDRVKNKQGQLFIQTKSRPNEKIKLLNEFIKKIAADKNCVYLDYFSAMVEKDGTLKDKISYDGLHPNDEGYKLMQILAAEAISTALAR